MFLTQGTEVCYSEVCGGSQAGGECAFVHCIRAVKFAFNIQITLTLRTVQPCSTNSPVHNFKEITK